MTRLTIDVPDEVYQRLVERARARGLSEEELLGEAVRQSFGDPAHQERDERDDAARAEWEEVMALMRARAALPVSSAERSRGRGWTREEIYDEP